MVGPHFFKAVTVNGERYRSANGVFVATCVKDNIVLHERFSDRVISGNGDLKPCDFFFWSFVSSIFIDPPTIITELKKEIRRVIGKLEE